MKGREGEVRGVRSEKRGGRRERGEKLDKKGREGKGGIFARAKRAPLREGRKETRGREGEVRAGGEEAYPPVHPLIYVAIVDIVLFYIPH